MTHFSMKRCSESVKTGQTAGNVFLIRLNVFQCVGPEIFSFRLREGRGGGRRRGIELILPRSKLVMRRRKQFITRHHDLTIRL